MKKVFIDSSYLVALVNTRDQHYTNARKQQNQLAGFSFVTSELVLVEVLNYYAEQGDFMRKTALDLVRDVLLETNVEIIPTTSERFFDGISLYESRLDKGYSLTDCISMNIMRDLEISEILTSDSHFTQEGFTILL